MNGAEALDIAHMLPPPAVALLTVCCVVWLFRIDRAVAILREQVTQIAKHVAPRHHEQAGDD